MGFESEQKTSREWWHEVPGHEKAAQLISLLIKSGAVQISQESLNLISDRDFRKRILENADKVVEAMEADPPPDQEENSKLRQALADQINKQVTRIIAIQASKIDTSFLRKKKD